MSNQVGNDQKPWRFLTNHTQVLLAIARDPDVRLRDVAEMVGITERAAQRIVADLIESGYLKRERIGRRNHYRVNRGERRDLVHRSLNPS
jgi:predicted transcriptional regulator